MTNSNSNLVSVSVSVSRTPAPTPPAHHVLADLPSRSWWGYLPHWDAAPVPSEPEQVRTGFRNPWPARTPTLAEVWNALEWGEDRDPAIGRALRLALAAADQDPEAQDQDQDQDEDEDEVEDGVQQREYQDAADRLLTTVRPKFSFDPAAPGAGAGARVTWLGHASVLLQLSPSPSPSSSVPSGTGTGTGTGTGEVLSVLFDPIFSARCSPTQLAGPARAYAPPCAIAALPRIDLVALSHNHYDHTDYATLRALWERNPGLQFAVPLGMRLPFVPEGEGCVHQLDWWDSLRLRTPGGECEYELVCTPARHSSGRMGVDANVSLWCSWYTHGIFFAGDTGVAPFFDEIRARLGPPHLALLPISVGATFSYLRSTLPTLIPRLNPALTSNNHITPPDAVNALKALGAPLALAIHWGTFVQQPVEVLKSIGALHDACTRSGVQFARAPPPPDAHSTDRKGQQTFVVLNHGESLQLPLDSLLDTYE